MDTPRSIDVSATPLVGRALRAVTELDTPTKLAIPCIIVGWFFMNTLLVSLGSLQHGVRFFDLGAVIANPARLFFGVDAPLPRIVFGFICIACCMAPLAAPLAKRRGSWLAYAAPLALMVVCGAILYSRNSSEFLNAPVDVNSMLPVDVNSMKGDLVQFANRLIRQSGDLGVKHIAIGAGGYLAFIGALLLAVQGLRRRRLRA